MFFAWSHNENTSFNDIESPCTENYRWQFHFSIHCINSFGLMVLHAWFVFVFLLLMRSQMMFFLIYLQSRERWIGKHMISWKEENISNWLVYYTVRASIFTNLSLSSITEVLFSFQNSFQQEAHGPHRSPEKTVQINKHIWLYHNDD